MTTSEQQAVPIEHNGDHLNGIAIELILFSIDGNVWIARHSKSAFSLPLIWIPKWTRVAQEAVKAARCSMSLEIFCLWEILEAGSRYLVARIKDTSATNSDLAGVPVTDLPDFIHTDGIVRLVQSAHHEAFAGSETPLNEPFKRIDWDVVLHERLIPAIASRDVELTGATQQLNASETFALLKLETTGSPIWFKAVGAPNLAEYSVTLGLDDLFPGVIPPIIARFPEWNGWVTEDAGGRRLDNSTDVEDWKRVSVHLADLQILSLQHVDDLFRIGCADWRTSALADHLEPFIEAMQRAMTDDQELKLVRLDRGQIDQVANAIRDAIDQTIVHDIPDGLVHRDLSGGNIQLSPTACHFIDWAQACIGHPFICSEYMKVHFTKAIEQQPNFELQVAELSAAYASRWTNVLSPTQLEVALKHSPILAEYLYVLPMDGRSLLDLLKTRENRAVLRSIARRMWSEMQSNSACDGRSREIYHA
jgi:hypothetical protein